MRVTIYAFGVILGLLVWSGGAQAWQFQKQGDVLVATELVGEWGTYFSGNKQEAVFCFTGPFRVKKAQTYTAKLKVGSGKWFDAPLTAYDDETLCTIETKKALGLVGAITSHGSLGFGLTIGDQFKHVIFYAKEWRENLFR